MLYSSHTYRHGWAKLGKSKNDTEKIRAAKEEKRQHMHELAHRHYEMMKWGT